jgi:hypothetical protein
MAAGNPQSPYSSHFAPSRLASSALLSLQSPPSDIDSSPRNKLFSSGDLRLVVPSNTAQNAGSRYNICNVFIFSQNVDRVDALFIQRRML